MVGETHVMLVGTHLGETHVMLVEEPHVMWKGAHVMREGAHVQVGANPSDAGQMLVERQLSLGQPLILGPAICQTSTCT